MGMEKDIKEDLEVLDKVLDFEKNKYKFELAKISKVKKRHTSSLDLKTGSFIFQKV